MHRAFDWASISLCGALALAGACGSGNTDTPTSAAGGGGAGGTGASGPYSGGDGGNAAKGGVGGQGGQMGAGARGGSNAAAGSGGVPVGARCFTKPLFSSQLAWNQRVDSAPKDAQSDAIIAALQDRGWGFGRLQIDFSIDVLCADANTPRRTFEPTSDFYDGDCDVEAVPVPSGGHLEGESGYECEGNGDCHLIVIAQDTNKLYEQWRVHIDESGFRGGCLAVWQLDRNYGPGLRGEQCTSADAAGLPIAPLLFDADEVAGGAIEHAVRFAIPNTHIRHRTYVRPATHATGAASTQADGVPYGARLRLRADYPVAELPTEGARVLARALQRYGMILADGGNIALMGQDDRSTQAKWAGLLEPRDLDTIEPNDFELVEAGERFMWTGDCMLEE